MKSSRPSLRESQNKQPLTRDPDKSWREHHTMSMITLFWSQTMDINGSIRVCYHGVMGCDQQKLNTSVEVTPAPVWVPTQQSHITSFALVVG
jgi:hypothetical protein